MKGYKGFEPGLVCRGKQYAENTVFEEGQATICKSGMHFCANPLDVLDYYPLINDNGELNEFSEVEALDDVKTDDNKKFCTKKLKIGAKFSVFKLGKLAAEFISEKTTVETKRADIGGDWAQQVGGDSAQQVGGYSAKQVGGDWAKQVGGYWAKQVGGDSAKQVGGDWAKQEAEKNSIMVAGRNSKFKAGLNSVILHYWYDDNGNIAGYKVAQVDGEKIKADTWYTLKDGEFVEVEDDKA